jgi:hypothetical protein
MPPIMRKSVVGGPLLGDRENANRGKEAQSSSVTFEPLVSDVLDENKSERFVLSLLKALLWLCIHNRPRR